MTDEHEKKDIVPEATAVLERKATTPKTARAKPADTGIIADFTDKFCDTVSSLKFTKKCAERKSEKNIEGKSGAKKWASVRGWNESWCKEW